MRYLWLPTTTDATPVQTVLAELNFTPLYGQDPAAFPIQAADVVAVWLTQPLSALSMLPGTVIGIVSDAFAHTADAAAVATFNACDALVVGSSQLGERLRHLGVTAPMQWRGPLPAPESQEVAPAQFSHEVTVIGKQPATLPWGLVYHVQSPVGLPTAQVGPAPQRGFGLFIDQAQGGWPLAVSEWLAKGMPLIVVGTGDVATFVGENHCGLTVSGLSALPKLVNDVNQEKFAGLADRAIAVGELIRHGRNLQAAVMTAVLAASETVQN